MSMRRRDFLKAAVAGSATAAVAPAAEARPNLEVPPNAIGMLYDSTLCIGCKACMVGCKEANDMPVEAFDESPMWETPVDTSGKTLNIIKLYRDGTAETKDAETDGYAFVKRHCMHCVDPGCISVCPTKSSSDRGRRVRSSSPSRACSAGSVHLGSFTRILPGS